MDEAERLLRAAKGRVVVALSGSETVEQAYALAKLVRVGLDSHEAMLPEEVSPALDAYRAPLSSIADADVIVVLGDIPLQQSVHRSSTCGCAPSRARARASCTELDDKAVKRAERADPHLVGPRRPSAARPSPSTPSGSASRAPSTCPDAERPRRRRRMGGLLRRRTGRRRIDRAPPRLGRRGRERPERPRARREGGVGDRGLDVPQPRGRLGRPRPRRARATSSATARTSTSRAACSACAGRRCRPRPTSSRGSRSSRRASASRSRRTRSVSSHELSEQDLRRPPVRRGRRARTAAQLRRGARARRGAAAPGARSGGRGAEARVATSRSSPAPRSSASKSSSSSGLRRRSSWPRDDAKARGIANGTTVTVSHNGTSVQLRARIAQGPARGRRAHRARARGRRSPARWR